MKKRKQFSWLQPRIVESAVFKNDLDKSSAWRCTFALGIDLQRQISLHIPSQIYKCVQHATGMCTYQACTRQVELYMRIPTYLAFQPCTYHMIWRKPFQLSLREEQGALHTRRPHLSKKLGVGLCQGPWHLWRGNITCFFFLSKFVLAPE